MPGSPEFRSRTAKGKVDRKQYWHGKRTVRDLAAESSERLRADQYDLPFRPWSYEAHAAPGALIASMFPRTVSRARMIGDDSVQIAETLTITINFFLELWALLPHVPQATPEQKLAGLTAAMDEAKDFCAWPAAPDRSETGGAEGSMVSDTSQS
jgi:hypothetical protein